MGNKVFNMIEYQGISDFFPDNPTTFTQITVCSDLCIPSFKPNIQRVTKITSSVSISDYKVIKTPIATSLEGQNLTGSKLIVHGTIRYVVVYIADDSCQSLYSSTFQVPFCTYVVLPEYFLASTPIDIVPYIEDVYVDNFCLEGAVDIKRIISICASLFIDIKFCCQCNKGSCSCNICAKTVGVSSVFPSTLVYFKQVAVDQELVIPENKSCIEDLISINSSVEVESYNLVETIVGTSLEGQNLTGCKLSIELSAKDILVYSTARQCNNVQSCTFNNKICCIFVVVPCTINGVSTEKLVAQGNLTVTPYIEDICAMKGQNPCTVHKCLSLLLNVTTRCV